MTFDNNGHLIPYQIIETDMATFEHFFVTNFIKSTSRKDLFKQFSSYVEDLKHIVGGSFYLWIDGSFVSQKLNPKDIDILIFVESVILKEQETALNLVKKRFQPEIDSYFIEVLAENHPKYFLFEINQKEWLFTFSTSRSFQNKGIIQINF